MQLKTLGGLEIDGEDFKRPKPLLMLSYLGLEGAKDSKHLSKLFFSQSANPAQQLSVTVNRLKKGIPDVDVIQRDDNKNLIVEMVVDATTMLETLESGNLEQGLELYEGKFLEGVDLPDINPELEEWIFATREFIAHKVRQALLTLAEKEQDTIKTCCYAERAYHLAGAPEPSPQQFQQIYKLLVKGDSHLAPEVKSEAESFGIQIEFESQTSVASVQENQVLDQILTTESDIDVQVEIQNNLPTRLSTFVGRESELDELTSLLMQADTRLVTLLGIGGTGKTSLALHLLNNLLLELRKGQNNQYEGLYFVPLETQHSDTEMFNSIANALAISLQPQQEVFEQLKDHLKDKSYLIVLDNFDHLVSKAGFVTELLKECRDLKILTTSREKLNLTGELVHLIGGLELPLETDSLEQAKQREAIKLFLDRAKTVDLHFEPNDVVLKDCIEICKLVHGLPLGIELSAAWVKLIPVAEMKEEIQSNFDFLEATKQDVLDRHQSLNAVFEHSWKLLSQKEQDVLKQLSVFRGGFTRQAAREVADANIPVLMSLINKSLLRVDNYRYDFHPLVMQYSFQKLSEDKAQVQSIQEAHAHYYLNHAEEISEDIDLIKQLEGEMDNHAAAFDWADQSKNVEFALSFANVLKTFWLYHVHAREASFQLERILTKIDSKKVGFQVDSSEVGSLLARAYINQGYFVVMIEGYVAARPWCERGLALAREINDKDVVLDAYLALGHLQLLSSGVIDLNQNDCKIILELGKDLNIPLANAKALLFSAVTQYSLGNYHESISYYEKAIGDYKSVDWQAGIATNLQGMSLCYKSLKEYDKATQYQQEGIQIFKQYENKYRAWLAAGYTNLADIQVHQKQYQDAKTNFLEAARLYHEVAAPSMTSNSSKVSKCFALVEQFAEAAALIDKLENLEEQNPSVHQPKDLLKDVVGSVSNAVSFSLTLTEFESAQEQVVKKLKQEAYN